MSDFSLPTKRDVRKEVQTHSAMQSNLSRQENDIKSRQSSSFTASSNDPFTTPTRDNYQTYPYDYMSGSDVKIYFGDIFVDEIVTIQYNVSQSKTPIYGYASQYFDGIAKGQVLVEGTLSINFKETGYLNIIQATLEAQKGNASSVIKSKINEITEENKYGLAKFVPGLNYIGNQPNPEPYTLAYSANGTPQFIRQQQTIEDILASKKKNTSAAVAKTLGIQNKQRDFEDFAEILEDTLWGDSNGKAFDLNNKLKRADEFDYNLFGGITIAKNRNYANVLNILISFGDITDYRAEHTITVLNDVHFTSTSMICSPTGDPIAEVYTFIARDINDSINNKTIRVNPIKLNVGNDNITLSKLEDIDKIQKQLDKVNNTFTIQFEAAYGPDGWIPYQGEIEFIFVQSNVEPFVDYLCKRVEDNINALYVPEIVKTLYEQYIVKVTPNNSGNSITMILEQKTKGTRSYRVISPTRSNFDAVSIINRDDLFDAKVLKSNPLPTKKDPNQKKNESIDLAEKEKELYKPTASYTFDETEVPEVNSIFRQTIQNEYRPVTNNPKTSTPSDVTKVNKSELLKNSSSNLNNIFVGSDIEKQNQISAERSLDEATKKENQLRYESDKILEKLATQELPWYDRFNPFLTKKNREKIVKESLDDEYSKTKPQDKVVKNTLLSDDEDINFTPGM